MTFRYSLLMVLFGISLSSFAQTALPYYTGFNDSSEQSGWEVYRLGPAQDPSYSWAFSAGNLVHFYPVGGSEETDDWIVSPPFDFTNGGMIDSLRYRFAGFGTPFGVDTIALYVLTDHPHPDTASSLSIIRLYTDSTYQNDNLWRKDSALQIAAHPGISYLAFRYKTVVNWLDTAIDDLYIDGSSVSIDPLLQSQISVFPNPSQNKLSLRADPGVKIGSALLINLQGQSIAQYDEGFSRMEVGHLARGFYYLQVSSQRGIHTIKVQLQ